MLSCRSLSSSAGLKPLKKNLFPVKGAKVKGKAAKISIKAQEDSSKLVITERLCLLLLILLAVRG